MAKKSYRSKRTRGINFLYFVAVITGISVYYFDGLNLFDQGISILTVLVVVILCGLFVPGISRWIKKRNSKRIYKNSSLFHIDKMDGVDFERYLKWLFEQRGFKAKVTQSSRDYGADLIIEKGNRRVAIQAKRYSSNVGLQAIQEVFTAQHYYNCHESWVVTNSYFTKSAQTLGNAVGVKLIGRNELNSFVSGENKESLEEYKKMKDKLSRNCPKCGENLVIRKSTSGEFYGCSKYPTCKHTERK